MSEELVVVHTEWGRHWSGGTQQVALLLEGLAQRGVKGCLVCQEGSMLAERMQGKVALKTFNLRGEHDLFTWRKFAQWLKVFKERQESLGHKLLVHVHSRKGALPTLLIAKRLKLKTVLHWRVAAPMPSIVRRLADVVIAISNSAAEQARKIGIPEDRLVVIYSGVDIDRFTVPLGVRAETREIARTQFGIAKDDFVVVAVGRLVPLKGYDLLLETLALFPLNERPKVLLVGDGEERPNLERLATKLGLEGWVQFLGFLSDIRLALFAADVFVQPSRNEGLGVAILEAMASGLPVIASRVGGIPEIVRDGETGLLFTPNDPFSLKEALTRIRRDEDLRHKISKRAQEWVAEHHDIRLLPVRVHETYLRVSKG